VVNFGRDLPLEDHHGRMPGEAAIALPPIPVEDASHVECGTQNAVAGHSSSE
jgi:hypothetical protein